MNEIASIIIWNIVSFILGFGISLLITMKQKKRNKNLKSDYFKMNSKSTAQAYRHDLLPKRKIPKVSPNERVKLDEGYEPNEESLNCIKNNKEDSNYKELEKFSDSEIIEEVKKRDLKIATTQRITQHIIPRQYKYYKTNSIPSPEIVTLIDILKDQDSDRLKYSTGIQFFLTSVNIKKHEIEFEYRSNCGRVEEYNRNYPLEFYIVDNMIWFKNIGL